MQTKMPILIDGEATAAKLMKAALIKAEEAVQQQGEEPEDVFRRALFSISYLAVRMVSNSGDAKDTVFNPELLPISPKTIVDFELAKLES